MLLQLRWVVFDATFSRRSLFMMFKDSGISRWMVSIVVLKVFALIFSRFELCHANKRWLNFLAHLGNKKMAFIGYGNFGLQTSCRNSTLPRCLVFFVSSAIHPSIFYVGSSILPSDQLARFTSKEDHATISAFRGECCMLEIQYLYPFSVDKLVKRPVLQYVFFKFASIVYSLITQKITFIGYGNFWGFIVNISR